MVGDLRVVFRHYRPSISSNLGGFCTSQSDRIVV